MPRSMASVKWKKSLGHFLLVFWFRMHEAAFQKVYQGEYIGCFNEDVPSTMTLLTTNQNTEMTSDVCYEKVKVYESATYFAVQQQLNKTCNCYYGEMSDTHGWSHAGTCVKNISQTCGEDHKLCVYSVCPRGRYGQSCERPCNCKNYVTCNRNNGTCPDDRCMGGWKGGDCNTDVNECDKGAAVTGCGSTQVCVNTPGSFCCKCKSGYRLKSNQKDCEDIDECSDKTQKTGCEQGCKNTPGSYSCYCKQGYTLDPNRMSCRDDSHSVSASTIAGSATGAVLLAVLVTLMILIAFGYCRNNGKTDLNEGLIQRESERDAFVTECENPYEIVCQSEENASVLAVSYRSSASSPGVFVPDQYSRQGSRTNAHDYNTQPSTQNCQGYVGLEAASPGDTATGTDNNTHRKELYHVSHTSHITTEDIDNNTHRKVFDDEN